MLMPTSGPKPPNKATLRNRCQRSRDATKPLPEKPFMADACRFVCDFEGCRSQESHQREKQLLQCHFAVSEPTNSSLFAVWYRIDAPEEIRTPDPQIRSLTLDILADAQRFHANPICDCAGA
jgi:hypothetical protein